MAVPTPRSDRQIDWRELVEKVDRGENRHYENLHPVAYKFSGNKFRRDSGPDSGIYDDGV